MDYTLADLTKAISMVKNVEKKEEYIVSFTKEDDGLWYVDYPNWPFDHSHLQMVRGADKLCELLSYDGKHTKVEVMIGDTEKEELEMNRTHHHTDIMATRKDFSLTGGADYHIGAERKYTSNDMFWLCPVTLFVLGHYPKYMRIRKLEG